VARLLPVRVRVACCAVFADEHAGVSEQEDPRVEVARRVVGDTRAAVLEGAETRRALLVGAEPAFVADKPVSRKSKSWFCFFALFFVVGS